MRQMSLIAIMILSLANILFTYSPSDAQSDYSRAIQIGETRIGIFVPDERRDVWRFDGTAEQAVTIALTTEASVVLGMSLYDANDEVLVESQFTGDDWSAIENYIIEADGTYFIKINYRLNEDYEAAYQLSLLHGKADSSIGIDESLMGFVFDLDYDGNERTFYEIDTDEDWSLLGQAGEIITLELIGLEDFQPGIRLYNEAGLIIAEDYPESYTDHGTRIENIVLPSTETYTISVLRSDHRGGAYDLTVRRGSSSDQQMPQIEEIGEITFDRKLYEVLEYPSERWQFFGSEGQQVNIELTSDFGGDLILQNSAGEILISEEVEYNSETAQIVDFVLPETDVYVVIVAATSFYNRRGLTLTYTLFLSEDGQADLINLTDNGGQIAIGDSLFGRLNDDQVVWEFFATTDDLISIEYSSEDYATNLTLQNPDSETLTQISNSSAVSTSAIEELEINETGYYRIVLSSDDKQDGGVYSLSVSSSNALIDDNQRTIRVIENDETISNKLLEGDEYWSFEALEGTLLNFDAISVDFRAGLTLIGPDGSVLIEETSLSKIFRYELPTTGSYQIVVTSLDGNTGDYFVKLLLIGNTSE